MLTKKAKIVIYILLSCLLLACVIGVCTIKKSDSTVVAVDVQDFNSNTNRVVFYDGEKIDTLMIGKWQHCMDTTCNNVSCLCENDLQILSAVIGGTLSAYLAAT